MFSQTFPGDFPMRVRSKLPNEGAISNARNCIRRLMPLSLSKPWFMAPNVAAASPVAANLTTNYHNNVIPGATGSSQRWAYKFNCHNAAGAQLDGDKPPIKDDVKPPQPYHCYNPNFVRQVQSDQELPIHYWFYIYLYSSDVDKLLTPFVKLTDNFGADRRLTVIMNRCGVQIVLKELELYKSLPRRIVVIKAAEWAGVVNALIEMEERLPDLMRFATYPLLLDTDTAKFACTKFDRTACVNRLTKPIY